MSFIKKSSGEGYVNVSPPWHLGQKQQKQGMTEEEIKQHHKVWGRHVWVSDKTTSLLYKIEPNGPEYITLQSISNSWDKPLSKVLKYYIDSTTTNQDLEKIRQLNKQKVDKMPELSFNERNKNRLHVWVETFELLEHIKSNYFTLDTGNEYISGYFGHNDDTVLQVILEHYLSK